MDRVRGLVAAGPSPRARPCCLHLRLRTVTRHWPEPDSEHRIPAHRARVNGQRDLRSFSVESRVLVHEPGLEARPGPACAAEVVSPSCTAAKYGNSAGPVHLEQLDLPADQRIRPQSTATPAILRFSATLALFGSGDDLVVLGVSG
jgi:hypothetical protein